MLCSKLVVNEAHWPGYDFRRHQTGKSFRQRVGSCFHYSFRLGRVCTLEEQHPTINLLRVLFDQASVAAVSAAVGATVAPSTSTSSAAATEASNTSTVPVDGPTTVTKTTPKLPQHQEQKTKKRKMHQLVEGRFRIVTVAEDPSCTTVSTLFECLTCLKRFPTEQVRRFLVDGCMDYCLIMHCDRVCVRTCIPCTCWSSSSYSRNNNVPTKPLQSNSHFSTRLIPQWSHRRNDSCCETQHWPSTMACNSHHLRTAHPQCR